MPMDSGRYADVLINIAAAVLIFFLPGGYTISLLVLLVLSHTQLGLTRPNHRSRLSEPLVPVHGIKAPIPVLLSFVLCFDHFRVLRCVPSFCFSSGLANLPK